MFELQQTDGCVDDAVLVYDGKTDSSSEKKLCSRFQEAPVSSTGRYLLIKFRSDNTVSYRGFDARFEVTSDPLASTTPAPNQSITHPTRLTTRPTQLTTAGKWPQPKHSVHEYFLFFVLCASCCL